MEKVDGEQGLLSSIIFHRHTLDFLKIQTDIINLLFIIMLGAWNLAILILFNMFFSFPAFVKL